MPSTPDLAQIRYSNAMALFDEFVHNTVKHPDAATLRGLEGRFALQVQVQPSYWSQIKSRSRQIGERLARQFEQLCHKPYGWMDQLHSSPPGAGGTTAVPSTVAVQRDVATGTDSASPRDDDERFIVGLVLTYYRRHPQRARTRLLDLLGEVLNTPPSPGAAATRSSKPAEVDDAHALWLRTQASVAPLKQKK